MSNFVRTPWGIECFLCKVEYGYEGWMLLDSNLSDDQVLQAISAAEHRLQSDKSGLGSTPENLPSK